MREVGDDVEQGARFAVRRVPVHGPPDAVAGPQNPEQHRQPHGATQVVRARGPDEHGPVCHPQQRTDHVRTRRAHALVHIRAHVRIRTLDRTLVRGQRRPCSARRTAGVQRPDLPAPGQHQVDRHQVQDVVAAVAHEDAAVLQRQHSGHEQDGHGAGVPAHQQQRGGDQRQRVHDLEPDGAVRPHEGGEGLVVRDQLFCHVPAPRGVGAVHLLSVRQLPQQEQQVRGGEADPDDGALVRAEGRGGDALDTADDPPRAAGRAHWPERAPGSRRAHWSGRAHWSVSFGSAEPSGRSAAVTFHHGSTR